MVIGAAGQIGRELRRMLAPLGDLVTTDRALLDLVEEDSIRGTIRANHPDLIVNAAAYTNVDAAEAEPDLAMKVNAEAPRIMAQEALSAGALLIHYSTDYVFSGARKLPYREEDEPDPINRYGQTKLAGELAIAETGVPHLILRTSWVFGEGGKNFFRSIVTVAREREELRVVEDQVGKPNWSRSVATATAEIVTQLLSRGGTVAEAGDAVKGVYHLCGDDYTSRFGFAQEVIALYRRRAQSSGLAPLRVKRLIPVRSDEFPAAARRPEYSVLSCEKMAKAFGVRLPLWREQLASAFEQMRL